MRRRGEGGGFEIPLCAMHQIMKYLREDPANAVMKRKEYAEKVNGKQKVFRKTRKIMQPQAWGKKNACHCWGIAFSPSSKPWLCGKIKMPWEKIIWGVVTTCKAKPAES